jgi:hypothetical protein
MRFLSGVTMTLLWSKVGAKGNKDTITPVAPARNGSVL